MIIPSFNPEKFKEILPTKKFGKNLIHKKIVGSTNDIVIELASQNAPEGTVVIAERQNKSRGRMGREWYSPPGGLWFSLVLRPPIKYVSPLTLIFGASVSKSIEEFTGVKCGFHWTNDIYVDDKKLGGILLESRFSGDKLNFVAAGIGINLNIDTGELGSNLKAKPISLKEKTGKTWDPTEILVKILTGLESHYESFLKKGAPQLINSCKKRCVTINRPVEVFVNKDNSEKALAVDIDPQGGVVIRYPTGEKKTYYTLERLVLK